MFYLLLAAAFLVGPASWIRAALSQVTPQSAAATAPAGQSTASPFELVIKVAGQSDPVTRREAAVAILHINSPDAVKALLTIFDSPNNEAAKVAVCEAIAQVKSQDPAFIAPLLNLLGHKDPPIRDAAAAALAAYKDPQVIARLKQRAVEQERQLLIENLDFHMRLLWDRSTVEADRSALLLRWLKSPLVSVRTIGLDVLHQSLRKGTPLPDSGTLQQIRDMLHDPDETVRKKVVLILRDRRQPEDAPFVQATLATEESPAVLESIYNALGWLGNADALEPCVKGLQHSIPAVAAEAAGAIGRLVSASPKPPADEIAAAAKALQARLAQPVEDAKLRERLLEAAGQLGDPSFLPVLTQYAAGQEPVAVIRQVAMQGIARVGTEAQSALVEDRLVHDPDAGVREAAAEALARFCTHVEHLRLLRDRLNPTIESAANVQAKAWEAYQQIFARLSPEQQQTVVDQWSEAAPAVAARRAELLVILEKQATAAVAPPDKLATLRERLGEALLQAGQFAEAAAAFGRALDASPAAGETNRRLLARLVAAHLEAAATDKAITAASAARSAEAREAVAAEFLKYMQARSRANPSSVLKLLDALKAAVPDQFGQNWAAEFDKLRRELSTTSQPATRSVGVFLLHPVTQG